MANMTDGWSRINSQQYGSVTKQLAQGVRAFALDVFAFVAAPGAAQDLFLCHGECGGSFSGPMPPRRLADTLGEIVTFLNANPNEFVTILFETGDTINPDASRNTLFEAAFTSSGATDLIFWPDSTNANPPANARTWNVNPNCGNTYTWPLIDDLKQANKRLAMFVDKDLGTNGALPRHIVPFVWRYMRENTYSDQDFFNIWSAEATERGESQSKAGRLAQQTGRSALILNHFPAVPHLHTWINYFFMNSYDRLLARTKSNVALFGIVPNFIQIDFIEVGGAARLVKTINEKVWTSSDPVAALNALEPDAIDRGL
jgi:hypothetical protein